MIEPTPRDPKMAKIEISVKVTRPEAYSNELLMDEEQTRVVELTRDELKGNIEFLVARATQAAIETLSTLRAAINEESEQAKHAKRVAEREETLGG